MPDSSLFLSHVAPDGYAVEVSHIYYRAKPDREPFATLTLTEKRDERTTGELTIFAYKAADLDALIREATRMRDELRENEEREEIIPLAQADCHVDAAPVG